MTSRTSYPAQSKYVARVIAVRRSRWCTDDCIGGLLEEHDDAILSLNITHHLTQRTGIIAGLAHPDNDKYSLVTGDERVS